MERADVPELAGETLDMMPTGRGYRADIDGMRAIAVGLVVIFHFQLLPIGEAGFIGVDIFFVISGFLITRIILSGIETGAFRLRDFYLARIRRLLPALLTVLTGYLLTGYFLLLPDRFAELALEAALSQLYLINFYFWRTINYFGLQADSVPLLHMWSLAVEEQFYIFYPLFLIVLCAFARARVFPILLIAAVLSFALGWYTSLWKPWAAFYLLPTRTWELLAGGILGAALLRGWQPGGHLIAVAGPVGLGLIALALIIHQPYLPFPGWFAALPVFGAVALLASGLHTDTPVSRLLSLPPLRWIGKISYPLYLIHWPVIILAHETLLEFSYGWRMAGLCLSVLLSWAIVEFIEAPIRQRRMLSTTIPFLVGSGIATALLLAISYLGITSNGLPERYDPEVSRILSFAEDRSETYARCDWPVPACPIGPEGPPEVVLFGDSHAQALAGAFDLWLKQQRRPGSLLFGSGCAPVIGVGPPRCVAFIEAAMQRIEANKSTDTVVLLSIWRQAYEGTGLEVNNQFLKGEELRVAFTEAIKTTVTRLSKAGKKVVFVDPLYAAPRSVPRTLAANLAYGRDWPVDTSYADHKAHFAPLYQAFDQAKKGGARRISFVNDLCADEICPGTMDGDPIFSDNNHIRFGLMPFFADILSRDLTAEN